MPPPRREDPFSMIAELAGRVTRLENLNSQRSALPLANVDSPPATPDVGGAVYVEAGVLKYIGEGGTTTTVAPS